MLCCKCKKEIDENDLFCRYCGERQNAIEKRKWSSSIFERFSFSLETQFPFILKEEYERIFQLLDDGQTYGAVLQMRDVYEVALKFPVIIALAYICSKEKLSEVEYRVVAMAVEKELSSGTWHEILRLLLQTVEEPALLRLLQETDELWSWDGQRGIRGRRKKINTYTGFSHWRNATIGHGALAFDDQTEFQVQFEKMIELLNVYMEMTEEEYAHLAIQIENGHALVHISGKEVSLYPFAVVLENSIYFFDAFLYGKRKYDILNYQSAEKISRNKDTQEEKQIESLYAKTQAYLSNLLQESKLSQNRNVLYADWHTTEEEQLLEKSVFAKRLHKIEYLTDWLDMAVKSHHKLFLLAMQSGMGKSTWCRTFDKKYCGDTEELDDYEVKVVYINKFYNKTESSILMSIQDALMLNAYGEKTIKMDNPRYLNKNAKDKKKELAELLEFYRKKMYEVGAWKKEKLLLVLDGLDEIYEGSLLDWIPTEELLGEHIKILFTARYDDRFSEKVKEITNATGKSFTASNHLLVTDQTSENTKILLEYLYQYMKKQHVKLSDNDIRFLLDKSQYNFLKLNSLLQIVKRDGVKLPQDENYYVFLLEQLTNLYSEKFAREVTKVLGVLAMVKHPMNIFELSQVLGKESPDYMLAAHLNDLQSFLVVEYLDGNAYYAIAHDEIYEAVTTSCWYDEEQYLGLVKNCILDSVELVKLGNNRVESVNWDSFRGVTFLFQHMDLLPEKVWDLCSEKEISYLLSGWADICNWIAGEIIYSNLTAWEKFKITSNLSNLAQKICSSPLYFMFQSYLRMCLLSEEFVAFYSYGEEEFEFDNKFIEILSETLQLVDQSLSLSRELKNMYDRMYLTFPAYAGRVCLKGILRFKKEESKKYEDAYVHALKYAIDYADKIKTDIDFSDYDRDMLNQTIRELGFHAQTLIGKALLHKYQITDLRERIMQFPEKKYVYVNLYKQSLSLGMDWAPYLRSKQKISVDLLERANLLYDAIQVELEKEKDVQKRYALVSYLPPVIPIYMRHINESRKRNMWFLEKEKETLLKRVMSIYELYEKNNFHSHELQFYINALVTYAASYYNRGEKEIGVDYFKKTLEKCESYARKPQFRETSEILADKFNANYSLSLYYAQKGNMNIALKHIKVAQKIYSENEDIKRMYAADREIRSLMEDSPMFQTKTAQKSVQSTKIGRNEFCPCGSGKKYKHCCGKNK